MGYAKTTGTLAFGSTSEQRSPGRSTPVSGFRSVEFTTLKKTVVVPMPERKGEDRNGAKAFVDAQVPDGQAEFEEDSVHDEWLAS